MIVAQMATVVLRRVVVVRSFGGVIVAVESDFGVIDFCKVYYFNCIYVSYILTRVQISLQLNSESFELTY